eukprot:scaffold66546_cov15-Tisochrysis_lutea.AAC.1
MACLLEEIFALLQKASFEVETDARKLTEEDSRLYIPLATSNAPFTLLKHKHCMQASKLSMT